MALCDALWRANVKSCVRACGAAALSPSQAALLSQDGKLQAKNAREAQRKEVKSESAELGAICLYGNAPTNSQGSQ